MLSLLLATYGNLKENAELIFQRRSLYTFGGETPVGKIRIHQLAKELNVDSKELLELLHQLGEDVKSPLSSVDESVAEVIRELMFKGKGEKGLVEAERKKVLTVAPEEKLTVYELSQRIDVPVKKLVDWLLKKKNILVTPHMTVENEMLTEVARAFGYEVEMASVEEAEEAGVEAVVAEAETAEVGVEEKAEVKETKAVEETVAVETEVAEGATEGTKTTEETTIGVTEAVEETTLVSEVESIIATVAKRAEKIRQERESQIDPRRAQPRPPVVTVMGHVDHGKTTLLDYIRRTNVAAQEVGQITQRIGASVVEYNGKKIVFIDTPGHESFTALRARGAQVTDIAVLVVAADDGVMPQTIEAINHARAANVPIIVAINKIDKPEANPEKVKYELAEVGLVPVEWGGDTECINISALRGDGVNDLLEVILLQAELMDLKADPQAPAWGVILESEMDPKRGPTATVIVQQGTLKVGDYVVVEQAWGRIRAMFDDKGRSINSATPSMPVRIYGLEEVPEAGSILRVVSSQKEAKELAERNRLEAEKFPQSQRRTVTLEELLQRLKESEQKELRLILKADSQGSLDAVTFALQRLRHPEVKISIIHQGVGNVSESDVMLALASQALIVGFNVRIDPGARRALQREYVEVRLYQIIYELIDDIKKAILGILKPITREEVVGVAEVRATFRSGKLGVVAGCYVKQGKVILGLPCRVMRNGEVVYEGKIVSLRRFQEDRQEIPEGMECGIGIGGFTEYQIGDTIVVYTEIREERKLEEVHESPLHWETVALGKNDDARR